MDKKEEFADVMIPYVEFAENANERTPCILVLDCSGSMRGEPIKQLNTGLQALEKELKEDIDASSRVQLLVIKAYGKDDAEISADWVDAMNFTAPVMEASGLSPIGKAMETALHKIEEHEEDTIGGYVFGLLARKPKVGDIVDSPLCRFEIAHRMNGVIILGIDRSQGRVAHGHSTGNGGMAKPAAQFIHRYLQPLPLLPAHWVFKEVQLHGCLDGNQIHAPDPHRAQGLAEAVVIPQQPHPRIVQFRSQAGRGLQLALPLKGKEVSVP